MPPVHLPTSLSRRVVTPVTTYNRLMLTTWQCWDHLHWLMGDLWSLQPSAAVPVEMGSVPGPTCAPAPPARSLLPVGPSQVCSKWSPFSMSLLYSWTSLVMFREISMVFKICVGQYLSESAISRLKCTTVVVLLWTLFIVIMNGCLNRWRPHLILNTVKWRFMLTEIRG